MSLRRRLTYLLVMFAVFAVVSATATIYGVKLQVGAAIGEFEESLNLAEELNLLRRMVAEQVLQLEEIVEGRRAVSGAYSASSHAFFDRFRHAARVAHDLGNEKLSSDLHFLAGSLEKDIAQCVGYVTSERMLEAKTLVATRIRGELVVEIDAQLRVLERLLENSRDESIVSVIQTTDRVLVLTAAVAVFAAALVVAGTVLIRKWLFLPLGELHRATENFSRGDLSFRTSHMPDDELGQLGSALNTMAQSVADAQTQLRTSELKHRRLFEMLRDAFVIVDESANVIEYHDTDSRILGVEGADPMGRHLLQVWPEWREAVPDWPSLIRSVIDEGRWYSAVDIELAHKDQGSGRTSFVDLIVYRIEYGGMRRAVVILRDVTERHRLQLRLQRAETMEAIGTLTGGLAHDFNNLLASAIGSLSGSKDDSGNGPDPARIRTALRACRQAAGLSKRLLDFASGAHGQPQSLALPEVVELILTSLDTSLFQGIDVRTHYASHAMVRIDRDQFTQVVLNLIRNACDAMPDGGVLDIKVESLSVGNVDEGATPHPHVVLTVADTGIGMTPEAKKRVFEPFFTTKSRNARPGRGLGMATVFAAVKAARGFIETESELGAGTTFRVYLPEAIRMQEAPDAGSPATPGRGDDYETPSGSRNERT